MRVRNLRFAGLLGVGAMSILSILSASCGDLAKRLESKVAAVNLLLETRSPFTAGSAGSLSATGVTVNLVAIDGSIAAPTATPITGASVEMTVGSTSTVTVALHESVAGNYQAVGGSAGAPAFGYSTNATYAISMTVPSGTYAGTYTTKIKPPRQTEVSGIPDANAGQFQPHGQPLTVTITSGTYDFGIVVVLNSAGQVTYTNKPQTPQDYVNFVLGNFNGSITIPGAAFPDANRPYGLVIAGVKNAKTSDISPNLEILSHFLAGSAKTAVIVTN